MLSSFAMYAPLARSDYYEDSATPRCRQLTTGLPFSQLAVRRRGQHQDASHVHHHPFDK
jgi:hypothetical protein